jgi:hypothetical protein
MNNSFVLPMWVSLTLAIIETKRKGFLMKDPRLVVGNIGLEDQLVKWANERPTMCSTNGPYGKQTLGYTT